MDSDARPSLPSGVAFKLKMRELILASGSSRRHSLIDQLNLTYRIYVSNVDETVLADEAPEEYVCRMASTKAEVAFQANSQICSHVFSKAQVILAADTIIALDGEVLGKPKNAQDAKEFVHKLSNAEHDVLTALCIKSTECEYQDVVKSRVKFKLLNEDVIEAYCSTSEPYDKAGAYAIQGAGAAFVEYLSGSYTNVVGLPMLAVYGLLKKCEIL